EKVRAIAAPVAAGEGLELVDVELAGAGGRTTLRLYIDRKGGVSLDDCTSVSRAVSAALDVEDPIDGAYDLEVSSPGLDPPLRTPEHLQKLAGDEVRGALKPLRGADFAEVRVARDDGAMRALFQGGAAVVFLDDEEGRAAYTSRGGGAERPIEFRRATGETEQHPGSWAVPADQAIRAIEHYFLTGQRPSFVHWHQDSGSTHN